VADKQDTGRPGVVGAGNGRLRACQLVDAVGDELIALDPEAFGDDPYLLVALERAALQAKRALDIDDRRDQRRAMRIALDDLLDLESQLAGNLRAA